MKVVAEKLSNADFDSLRGLVKNETLDQLQEAIAPMTDQQRSEIVVDIRDIGKDFVMKIEITEKDDRSFVEIFMVYHVVRNMHLLKEGKIKPEKMLNRATELVLNI